MESQRVNGRRLRGVGRKGRRWRQVAGEVLRREGVARLLTRSWVAVRGIVYRDVVFVALDLMQAVPHVESRVPVVMRRLQHDDMAAYARFRAQPVERLAAVRRLEQGDACVAAWLDDEIVSAGWYSFETAWVDDLGRGLRLAPGEVFGYDLYTTERQRGLGVASVRGRWAAEHFRDLGYRRIVAEISPHNLPVHGTAQRLGYDTLGRAGFVRLGPWRRDFVLSAGGPRLWGRRSEPIDIERAFRAGGQAEPARIA